MRWRLSIKFVIVAITTKLNEGFQFDYRENKLIKKLNWT